MNIPDYSKSPPRDIAGYQLVCNGVVELGDIVVPPDGTFANEGQWARSLIGAEIDPTTHATGPAALPEGLLQPLGWHVYREMPCPKQGGHSKNDNGPDESVTEASGVPTKALTYDDGKPPLACLPWQGLREVAKVQLYGHKKYKDFFNYRKGLEATRNASCAMRHIADWMERRDLDDESGCNHLAHACCRLLFLLENIADGKLIDDRYRPE